MYFSKDEYKDLMKKFLCDHHGQIIKLKDQNGKIFSYIIRCESNQNDKQLLTFMVSFDIFYVNLISHHEPNAKEFKYYAIKRALQKWASVKDDQYVKYKSCVTDDFYEKLTNEIQYIRDLYVQIGLERPFDLKDTVDYIFKVLKSIKNYYKNENIDDFNLILL